MEQSSLLDIRQDLSDLLLKAKGCIPNLFRLFRISQPALLASLSPNSNVLVTTISMAFIAGDEIMNSIERRNLEIWMQEYMDRRIDDLLNPDNPEIKEFIQHAILKSVRCSKETQVKRIMDIFQAGLQGRFSSYRDAEDFMNIMSELSENEAILLAKIYKYFEDNPEINKFNEYKKSVFGNFPSYTWDYLLNRLEGKGLLKSETTVASDEEIEEIIQEAFQDKKEKSTNTESQKKEENHLIINSKTYLPTDFGKKLFQSIAQCQ